MNKSRKVRWVGHVGCTREKIAGSWWKNFKEKMKLRINVAPSMFQCRYPQLY
jgi:hypothetical protein